MAVYTLTRYPLAATLADGSAVTLRPLNGSDGEKLRDFFQRIPQQERFLLKDDITSSDVVARWTGQLDYDRALPLLAEVDGRVVADAVLIRHRGGWLAQAAEVRVLVDPDFRGRGLGTALLRELLDIAADAELDQVVFQFVGDIEGEAMREAAALGAVQVGCIEGLARDEHNHPHDLLFYTMPLGKWWEWARS
jgi:GNAT superfamily N-acetyltransferase